MQILLLYDERGTQYRAYVNQEWIDASSMDWVAKIPGMKTIHLQDGTPLNCIDDRTYKNALTGEVLSTTQKTR